MASPEKYRTDRIRDDSYSMAGDVVIVNGKRVIKSRSPNGFPGYQILGSGCSGEGCDYITPLTGASLHAAFVEHIRDAHDGMYDDDTGKLLQTVYLYAVDPDYTKPPNPASRHGNQGIIRAKK